MSASTFKKIADDLGLDMGKFNRDMKSPAVKKLIAQDLQRGREAGVSATPTVYINGKKIRNRSFKGLKKAIMAELAKQK